MMSQNDFETKTLPVAVIGAGPAGLSAAAHLVGRGVPFVVLESGAEAGAAIREWGHVRISSPWRNFIDPAAAGMLTKSGWQAPPPDDLPTGHDIVDRYLRPLSELPAIGENLRLRAKVTSIGRKDFDKVKSKNRDLQPFEITLDDGAALCARAVIDASGTWRSPNPLGAGGVFIPGEEQFSERLSYGIPDILGQAEARYKNQRVLVVGSGHSAINIVLALLSLRTSGPATSLSWAMRRENIETVFGGEDADALPARGRLGKQAREAIASKQLRLLAPFVIREISQHKTAMEVTGLLNGHVFSVVVDEIIVATGFRPQHEMLREIRLGLDSWLEAPIALAPLIDPNVHSCGTVQPHGARELAHPEADFFIIGMKSYGRAPTFLNITGNEQARSVAAFLAGDLESAARLELELPETGVCSTEDNGCCGGPAPTGVDACCIDDVDAKAAGKTGCGCGPAR